MEDTHMLGPVEMIVLVALGGGVLYAGVRLYRAARCAFQRNDPA